MWPFKKTKSKSEVLDELVLYKEKKLLEIERELMEYQREAEKQKENIALKCAEELGQYEHTYHYAKEVKGKELAELDAKIDAKIDAKKEMLATDKATYNLIVESKDMEIERLNKIINNLIDKVPAGKLTQKNINTPTR
jgi:hypothetical protein